LPSCKGERRWTGYSVGVGRNVESMEMGDMTEDVTKMWERFNILEEESVGIKTCDDDFEPLVGRGSACVMGKLLVDRTVGKEIIKTSLIRAWQPSGRVSFKSMGINTFLIEFENYWDKESWKGVHGHSMVI
jgi:hypothetical protein